MRESKEEKAGYEEEEERKGKVWRGEVGHMRGSGGGRRRIHGRNLIASNPWISSLAGEAQHALRRRA